MIFKPDIDYRKLLETGHMSHADLVPFYGRIPSRNELTQALKEGKIKHPEHAYHMRSCAARGLYLMDDVKADRYCETTAFARLSATRTAFKMHAMVPVAGLDAEQRKRHDAVERCGKTLEAETTKAVKALPWSDK